MSITIKRGPVAADNFTIISNRLLRDSRLSFKARGLACWLLSHREDFALTLERIAQLNECGGDQVRRGVIELEDCGYLTREQGHDAETGQFERIVYHIADLPSHDESPGQTRDAVSRQRVTRERETSTLKKTTSKKITKGEDEKTPVAAAPEQIPLPLPVPAALEKDAEDEQAPKPLTLNQRATQAAQWYYRHLGNMGNVPAMMKIIRKAMVNGHSNTQIKTALTFIADHHWTLTEERLAHALQGGPRPVSRPTNGNGRRKVFQLNPDGTSSGREIQVDW